MKAQAIESQTTITQHEIHRLGKLDRDIADLKATLNTITAERAGLEDHILDLLDSDADVENGKLDIEVSVRAGRRSPAWKKVCAQELGEDFVNEVIESTEPSSDKVTVNVISSR